MSAAPRPLGWALAAIVLGSTLAAAGPASAWCRMTTVPDRTNPEDACDPEGLPLEWNRNCIVIALHARGARDFSAEETVRIVNASFGTWLAVGCGSAPTDFDIGLLEERASVDHAEYNTDGGNINLLVWVADWGSRELDPRAFAVTTVWHNIRTGEIYDSDLEINEEIGQYADCPTPDGCSDGHIDLQNVLTHEVGHFFGIGHSDVLGSTMWWMAMPGDVDKRILRTDDTEAFCAVYPPGTLGGECSEAPSDLGDLGDYTPRGGLSLEEGGGGGGCGCDVPARSGRGAGAGGMALAAVVVWVSVARRRRR